MVTSTAERIQQARVNCPLDVQKLGYNLIGYSEEMQRRNRELKDFLYKNLYRHHRVVRMQVKAERIISDLFSSYRSEPLMLPEHVQRLIAGRGLERTICDYIAGMTDRFAIDDHQRLFEPVERP
jgi:dGTPase